MLKQIYLQNKAKYIIRLDDASEFLTDNKWDPFFVLLDKYNIKPIIAVIPNNLDPKLIKAYRDDYFWMKVKDWERNGYHIAMHGYQHIYYTKKGGVLKINNQSEFAGLSLQLQKTKIKSAIKTFFDKGVKPKIFIAPSHSFDVNTLKALEEESNIEIISDGFYKYPLVSEGFKWLPQQLWAPKKKKRGVWTICYHPEKNGYKELRELEIFIKENQKSFINIDDIIFNKSKKLEDYLLQYKLCTKYFIKRIINVNSLCN